MRSLLSPRRLPFGLTVLAFAVGCSGGTTTVSVVPDALEDAAAVADGDSGGDTGLTPGDDTGIGEGDTAESGADIATPSDAGSDTAAPTEPTTGACRYKNPFSQGDECKAYALASWTAEAAATDCETVLPGTAGVFEAEGQCVYESVLGRCIVGGDAPYVLVSAGTDATQCSLAQTGCQVFAKGTFEAGAVCIGEIDPGGTDGGEPGSGVFQQPYLDCREPLASEPAGQTDGKVCTWALISGCTEPGRKYQDYASCDDVLTQRPYYAVPAQFEPAGADDPRLADADYMGNVAWAKQQVEACACVCCHSNVLAPSGPALWYVEAGPIWTDSIRPSGLAMLAGLADSTYLGAFPAKDNNGFDRTALGIPTTDVERMADFLLGEWQRRGFTKEEGQAYPSFGGPLVTQSTYVPTPCEGGEGVTADGKVVWSGGKARYVYVLEANAKNPGVPPNLDVPVGTKWLVDVPSNAAAMSSPIAYAGRTGAERQRVPESGQPATLESGKTYYLYVLLDIGVPVTRCTFTAP
jgi:hypothetical protein